MSLGVGLGAFMDGFASGYGIRRQMDADKLAKDNRGRLTQIDTDAKAEFDKQVAAGTAKKDDFESFWLDYALPKRRNELLRQGDVEGARRLQEWGESDATIKGGKLFSSALLKAQTGDHDGAMRDVIKAGKIKGYIEHGYELAGQEPIKDADGNTVGYRLKIKQDDGDVIEQDIAVEDLPRLIATFANPDNAWQTHQAAQAAEQKRQQDLEDYKVKKGIDRAADNDPAKAYRAAREARLKNDLSFADMSPEEQDKLVRQDLQAADAYAGDKGAAGISGGAAPAEGRPAPAAAAPSASPKVVVDKVTGQQVPVSPRDAAPGLGAPAGGSPGIQRRPLPAAAPRPQAPEFSQDDQLAEASALIAYGGDPQRIAERLRAGGVPEDRWPDPLKRALQPAAAAAP